MNDRQFQFVPEGHLGSVVSGRVIGVALVAFASAVAGESLAASLPDAGNLMQQLPPTPALPKPQPDFDLRSPDLPKPSGLVEVKKIKVAKIRLTGMKLFSEEELLAAGGFVPGSELGLNDLRDIALKISRFYRDRGYFLAQTFIPVQDVKGGAVELTVVEGRYGRVTVDKGETLSDRVVGSMLHDEQAGAPVHIGLASDLLRLSDLAGIQVRSTLAPGSAAGTSDLLVDIKPGERYSGSIDADNSGSDSTGSRRLGATFNVNNPLGLGDMATFRGLSSAGGMQYGRASYQAQVGSVAVGAAYSRLSYRLGSYFAALDASGTAGVASVFTNYALQRTREQNWYLQLNFDDKHLHDRVGSSQIDSEKRANILTTSLWGNRSGAAYSGTWSLAWTAGRLDIRSPETLATDAQTAHSDGMYHKLAYSFAVQHYLTSDFSMHASVTGQAASRNLDSSKKIGIGGFGAVRAYAEGEAFGDSGNVLSLEGRYRLPESSVVAGGLQLVGFLDAAHATLNKAPWTTDPDTRTLEGGGLGMDWSAGKNYLLKAYYARKIDAKPDSSGANRNGRFWVQGIAYF